MPWSSLADGELVDASELGDAHGWSPVRVSTALSHLAATGLVGYDTAEGAYFHRALPWNAGDAEALNPRLISARRLVETAAVQFREDGATVSSSGSEHVVRGTGSDARCTCPWFAQYGARRGPCKHVLAVQLSRARTKSE